MNIPDWIYITIGLFIIAVAMGVVLWQRRNMRRIMERMNEMLDAAIDGSFAQHTFDESLLSSVESRLDKYLSASEASSRNLVLERDKINQLIADISHQTKTPIANILLYAQLLSEQPLSQESRSCVSALDGQAEKLSFLISSLVKLSRLEAGILVLYPVAEPLQPMLDVVHTQYEPDAERAGVTLSFSPTDDVAVHDAKWSAEALGNIVDNAIKYTPEGGSVSVSVTPHEMFCRIDVTDTGIGIAEAEQPLVFSRFYRSPVVSSRKGVGIGLYLARQIIAEQGGYMKLKSMPGKGSTFSIFLPRESEIL